MRIRKRLNNLKSGAKKVLIGLLILSVLSTASGIGTLVAYATEDDPEMTSDSSNIADSEEEDGESDVVEPNVTTHDEHDYKYAYNGDNSHIVTCSGCDYSNVEACDSDGENGACTKCGNVPESSENIDATSDTFVTSFSVATSNILNTNNLGAASNSAATGSTGDTSNTGATSSSAATSNSAATSSTAATSNTGDTSNASATNTTEHEHQYVYSSNEDGTHTITCALCDYEVTETCDELGDEGICSLCGYDPQNTDTTAPTVDNLSKNTSSDKITLTFTATDLESGVAGFGVYYSKSYQDAPSKDTVWNEGQKVEGDQITISGNSYSASYDISDLEVDVAYIFYVVAGDEAGNISDISSIEGGIYKENIDLDILYNGEAYKQWYNTDVVISASGYKIAATGKTDYQKYFKVTDNGTTTLTLDFQDENNTANPLKTYSMTIRIDRTAPTGKFSMGDYSSSSVTQKSETVFYTNSNPSVSISAEDNASNDVGGNSGIDYISYVVTDTFNSSIENMKAYMSENNLKWRIYTSGEEINFIKSKKNYVFIAIYDKAGNAGYISTGAIYYDTVLPVMQAQRVIATGNSGEYNVVLAAKDAESGVNRFKLIYKETSDEDTYAPTKEDIFNNGIYIETAKSEDDIYGASYKVTGLDASKNYKFFMAAVDRAGNISDIKSVAVKGEESSTTAGNNSSNSGVSQAGSSNSNSSLTAAPNGIAGSGSASSVSPSKAPKKTETQTETPASRIENYVIKRDPYIADATGKVLIGEAKTSGWDNVSKALSSADGVGVVEIEMSGTSQVPASFFEIIKGMDMAVRLRMPDGIKWEIKPETIKVKLSDKDMEVKLGSRNIPDVVISEVADVYPHVEFSTSVTGELGFDSVISVPVNSLNAGMNAVLYKYDSKEKELVEAGSSVVDENGIVQFDISEGADYTVIISPEKTLGEASMTTVSGVLTNYDSAGKAGKQIRLTDIFTKRGGAALWLFMLSFTSIGLCLAILFIPAFQLKRDDDFEELFKGD
ncbi:MAG: hypothetical protein J6O61_10705 [Butyrivibrio sp.]|uniref:hypothetical protein n=1 Tax=Butyrivibrio sp. TaxID=28121 RepID=UPI001B09AA6E|nr:hypothetical protein [Butyrivibrio sp.]MBO6241280.1 hypothetical protein [Butyrivibrio sp.]